MELRIREKGYFKEKVLIRVTVSSFGMTMTAEWRLENVNGRMQFRRQCNVGGE